MELKVFHVRQTFLLFLLLPLTACNHKMHQNIGMSDQKLKACPDSPNCVNSMYPEDEEHFMEAWTYQVDRSVVIKKLKEELAQSSKVTLKEEQEDYLHYAFRVPWTPFTDDVEFYFPTDEAVIHYRSASRVGYSDMGVNKKRMATLRRKLVREGAIEE